MDVYKNQGVKMKPIKTIMKALAILAGLPFILIGFWWEFVGDMFNKGIDMYDNFYDFLNDR